MSREWRDYSIRVWGGTVFIDTDGLSLTADDMGSAMQSNLSYSRNQSVLETAALSLAAHISAFDYLLTTLENREKND